MLTKDDLIEAGIDVNNLEAGGPDAVRYWSGNRGGTLWIKTSTINAQVEFPAELVPYGRFLFRQLTATLNPKA